MTIFRFSYIALSVVIIASGCTQPKDNVTSSVEPDLTYIEVKRDSEPFSFDIFAAEYARNPNKFDDEFFQSDFYVSGIISRLDLFPTSYNYTAVNGEVTSEPQYLIPLRGNGEDLSRIIANQVGRAVEVAVSMKDFSQEKAAKLSLGEKLTVHCSSLVRPSDGQLLFDGCAIVNEKEPS